MATDDVDVRDLARREAVRAGGVSASAPAPNEPENEAAGSAVAASGGGTDSETGSSDGATQTGRVDIADDGEDLERAGLSAAAATQRGAPAREAPSAPPIRATRSPASTPRSSPGQRAFRAPDARHPRRLWRGKAAKASRDQLGCGRTPAFWFTLNVPYNALHEIHRLAHAAARLALSE